MAKLHKRSVQEAVNATVGGEWSVQDALTAGSEADVTNTVHKQLATMTSVIGIHSAVEIYFSFATSETDIDKGKDLIIPKNTMIYLTVPRGLGNTVYFSILSTSTSTGAVRLVEI